MPIQVFINNKEQWIYPTSEWKTEILDSENAILVMDPDFYIETNKL